MPAVTSPELEDYIQRISELSATLSRAELTTPGACRALVPLTNDLAAAALTLRERLRLYIVQADAEAGPGGS